MELMVEEVAESSSPLPRAFGALSPHGIKNDIYNRLVEIGNEEALLNPDFRRKLEAHFDRLPPRYVYLPHLFSIFLICLLSVFVGLHF